MLVLLTVLGIVYLLSLAARIYLDGQRDEERAADVILVLGSAQYDGRPSPVLQARLDHALTLYARGYAPYLLFTGGKQPADRFTEADTGRRYAIAHGVPPSAIFVEPAGRTTWQSMQASTAILRREGLRTVILVSDPFHAFRLRRMARDLHMQAVVSPAAHSRVRSFAKQAAAIVREMEKYVVYRCFGF